MTISSQYGSKRGLLRFLVHILTWRLQTNISYPSLPTNINRLVFVCKGNICRSALAKTIADSHGITAESYGLETSIGKPADNRMTAIATKYGYSLDEHKTQSISAFQPLEGDLILVMDLDQYRKILELYGKQTPVSLLGLWAPSPRAYLHDPYSCGEAYFDTCYNLIEGAVLNLNHTIKKTH